jgi:fatty acid desaturase
MMLMPRRTRTGGLSRAEIASLTVSSDLRGAASVGADWALIGGAMAAVAAWPHPVVVGAALWVIGGRQLGLAVLTHECAHRSLFRTRRVNDVVGTWLCGAPIWADLRRYRVHHLAHHSFAGTEQDPDLRLVTPFPTTRGSLARKLLRDLLGITALRRVVGLLAMDLGIIAYTASGGVRPLPRPSPAEAVRNAVVHVGPVALCNAGLLGLLAALGHPALYLLWVGAWCTTYSAVLRVRSIAEHACTARSDDALRNTRTTRAGPLARLILAPHHVNYHVEHHLLMTVPHWHLPALHRLLAERGLLGPHNTAPSYGAVLRRVTDPG